MLSLPYILNSWLWLLEGIFSTLNMENNPNTGSIFSWKHAWVLLIIDSAYFLAYSFTCCTFPAESSFSQRTWRGARSSLSSARSLFFSKILYSVSCFLIAGFILEKFISPLWKFLLNVDKYDNISFKTYNTARNFMSSTFFSTPAAVALVLSSASSLIKLKICNKYLYSLYTASTSASKLSHLVVTVFLPSVQEISVVTQRYLQIFLTSLFLYTFWDVLDNFFKKSETGSLLFRNQN